MVYTSVKQKGVMENNGKLHPNWIWLMNWVSIHPHVTITIKYQDGIPHTILKQTEDGFGTETVLINSLARR